MIEQLKPSDSGIPAAGSSPVGIRGWLVLPAIGLCLGVLRGIEVSVQYLGLWPDAVQAGNAGLYVCLMMLVVGFTVFLVYVAALFFCKRRNAPSMFIAANCIGLALSALLSFLSLRVGLDDDALAEGMNLAASVVCTAIWISYFLLSKRVKATFVR